ncbi:MAG: hypothetical protein ABI823_11100 [Bryobacteraceae bacterium]
MSNSFENKSVNERNEAVVVTRPSSSTGIKVMLAVGLAAALGGFWYQSVQVSNMRNEVAATQRATQQKMDQLKAQFDEKSAAATAAVENTVARMNEDVAAVQRESKTRIARAQAASKQETGKVMQTLSAKNAELAQQLDQMKKESDSTITGIKGDVGEVKTDVAATRSEVANHKSELDKTIADLRRVTGDMGVMSGLIATNGSELDALKKLGERDYIEFTLTKNGPPQKIGKVQLALKKADTKRNRFTFDVLADEKKGEKKDKGVNEPVQFYTSNARQPYEVVVNQIGKDTVKGYLSVPKLKLVALR